MNTGPLRKGNAPLTPSIEDYRNKNKSKSRRKPNSILPTNPPTPKPHKAQIVIKSNFDKLSQGLRMKEDNYHCLFHPNQAASYTLENTNKRVCRMCYNTIVNGEDDNSQEIQQEKRKELVDFKGRIKGFGLKLEEASDSYDDWSHQIELNFYHQREYITETFETIKSLVDQKKRELINQLLKKQKGVKSCLIHKNESIEQIKSSINRYMQDIDDNYDQIINQLSFFQFTEIIQRYNKKIEFFEEQLEDIVFQTTVNVYIPKTEIKRFIDISEVQMYPFQGEESLSTKNKTLQRYTTEKNNLNPDYHQLPHQSNTRKDYHHESLNNKPSQHRGSRDRYELMQKEVSINQMRNQANKENHYYDNLK